MENISKVAQETQTAKSVFDALSKRVRFRRSTNLDKFEVYLIHQGYKVVHEEYIKTFKALEQLGVGKVVGGRGSSAGQFVWNYNLKEVAKASKAKTAVDLKPLEESKGKAQIVQHNRRVTDKPTKDSIRIVIDVPSTESAPYIQNLIKALSDK